MLTRIQDMWNNYKKENQLVSDIMLDEVRFDAAAGVEASFDLMEMLEGRYILHLTERVHIYRGDFVKFLLYHEFTHLADFITYPYEIPSLNDLEERSRREDNVNTASDRDIFGKYGEIRLPGQKSREDLFKSDAGKRLFDYMNTWSEFHACQVALLAVLGGVRSGSRMDMNKVQIPAPFKEISLKNLLGDCLRRAHVAYQKFSAMLVPQVFVIYFKQIMYLFGYISIFDNELEALRQSFSLLGVSDQEEEYLQAYRALKEKRTDDILLSAQRLYQASYLLFVKEYIRKHYDPGLYTEEELDEITPDNYHDFIETITNRKGGRLWSGRVSPVYGVHNVDKAYGSVDVEDIKKIIEKNRKLRGGYMQPDFTG